MQLSHLIQWKLPARWSGNRAYARWVMLFIRLLWKGQWSPVLSLFLCQTVSQTKEIAMKMHIFARTVHILRISWNIVHLASTVGQDQKAPASTCFLFFFFLFGGKCDTIEPAFFVLALGFYFGYAPRFNGTQLVSTWKSATWVYNLWNWALSNRRFVGRMPCTRLTYMIGF